MEQLLRSGRFDVALVPFPVAEPDLVMGPALFSEPTVLAVSARHPFARRASVVLEDLARDKVLSPASLPEYARAGLAPTVTPSGRPIERGPEFDTVQEMLSLIGAGQGVYPVPAHAVHFDTRPDIVYVPISDGIPRERRFVWPATGETARVRAFTNAAADLVSRVDDPLSPHR